jgi:hypothetical protein
MRLLRLRHRAEPGPSRGQGLAEFALVIPIALLALFGILVVGLWIFYQQQVTNSAREAARYAAIHSSSAPCPTVSWRDPSGPNQAVSYQRCDPPSGGNNACPVTEPWPCMTEHTRTRSFGLDANSLRINACWSGYANPALIPSPVSGYGEADGFPLADEPPFDAGGSANTFVQCTIGGLDPTTQLDSLGCASGMTSASDDPASDLPGNQVTVYACYTWQPPLAGFLAIPSSITLKAVITEVIHRQQ